MSNEPHLIMFAGPNGSGKSSLITSSKLDFEVDSIINPDNYAKNLTNISDEYERYSIAMTQCALIREELLEKRISFGFETVASREDKLDFVKKAIEYGYCFELMFMNAGSPEKCYERIQMRVAKGGHDVPKDRVFSRYERTLTYLPEYIKLAKNAYVFDNSGNQPELVLEKSDEMVIVTDFGKTTEWASKYLREFF